MVVEPFVDLETVARSLGSYTNTSLLWLKRAQQDISYAGGHDEISSRPPLSAGSRALQCSIPHDS